LHDTLTERAQEIAAAREVGHLDESATDLRGAVGVASGRADDVVLLCVRGR
jgi:hypothetical protein